MKHLNIMLGVGLAFALSMFAFTIVYLKQNAKPPTPPPPPKQEEVINAIELMDKHQCSFCHSLDYYNYTKEQIDDPARNCAYCHWEKNIPRFYAPNLNLVGQKLRQDWLQSYLEKPFHVRPNFHEEMPDFDFSPAQAKALAIELSTRAPKAKKLTPVERLRKLKDPIAHQARLEQAKTLFVEFKCSYCHVYSGSGIDFDYKDVDRSDLSTDARYFAPNLRFSRDRLKPEWIPNYILKPTQYDIMNQMPAPISILVEGSKPRKITIEEAEALSYFILYAPLTTTDEVILDPEIVIPETIDYTRDVQPVFNKYCSGMCHYPFESEEMGWGTGHTGGFGYPRREFDLTSFEAMMEGSLQDDGSRKAMVIAGDLDSPLLQRMRGEIKPAMPMGIRIPKSAIKLLELWIEQGAKGPANLEDD